MGDDARVGEDEFQVRDVLGEGHLLARGAAGEAGVVGAEEDGLDVFVSWF